MRHPQRVADARRDPGRPAGNDPPVPPEGVGERLPRHVFHHDEVDIVFRAGIEHGDEIGMREPRGRERLTAEPLDERAVVGQPAPQDLDGDRPVQDSVGGQIDLGHPAPAEELADRIAVVEHPAIHAHASRLRKHPLSRS
jgi:hypothetical protein